MTPKTLAQSGWLALWTLGACLLVGCGASPVEAEKPSAEPVGSARPAPAPEKQPGKSANPILAAHNKHRAKHCAPPLRWSKKLAKVAERWANKLAKRDCALEHSTDDKYGENLFFGGPPGAFPVTEVVDGWYSEVKDYDYGSPRFAMGTGHFTQVVWKGTEEVGCATASCSIGDIVVCNYYPPGNVMGQFPANVKNPKRCKGR